MNESNSRHIATSQHDATLVVLLQDTRLRDAETCYALRDEILAAIDAAGAENVVLDLSQVEFLGSVGFLAFLGVRRRITSGRLILCGMSENIRELFRVCALISHDPVKPGPFEEAKTVETALASL